MIAISLRAILRVASEFFKEIPVYSSMFSSIFFKFQYVTKSDFKYIQVCATFVKTIFQHIPENKPTEINKTAANSGAELYTKISKYQKYRIH